MIKNQKVVFIGEDGEPLKNDDGSYKVIDLYRGSVSKEEHTTYLAGKASNLSAKNKELSDKISEFELANKKSEIIKLLEKNKIDMSFKDILNIDMSKKIEEIDKSLADMVKNNPKIAISDKTGGIPKTVNPENEKNINLGDDTSPKLI